MLAKWSGVCPRRHNAAAGEAFSEGPTKGAAWEEAAVGREGLLTALTQRKGKRHEIGKIKYLQLLPGSDMPDQRKIVKEGREGMQCKGEGAALNG